MDPVDAMDEARALELRQEREALRTSLGRVGVWSFALETHAAADERREAVDIEAMGYPAIWIPEAVDSREAFSHASWLLASTERATIATGIANIWARDATAAANGARMLADAYPGRFVLGIGVSHRGSVASRGAEYRLPYTRMREYLDEMDRAESTAPEPTVQPRIMLAALGPRMLELAAERTHGAHPYFVPVEHTAFARARLGPEPVLAVEQTVVLETDPGSARRIARRFAADYLDSPNYANNLRRMGYTAADVSGQGSDRVVDAVIAWGDVDRIASRVREHVQAGADHVCLQVVSDDEEDVGVGELRDLADAVLDR
ncbi:MAG TPA: TIGR03620 family F420-dependent LLM class oxidoreductase [Actinomycetota bacterium]|jgi:probable F420-dependent oxidoreductase